MTTTVLIPTYRRPEDLARCLGALKKQTRVPDEVIVVVRDSDAETWAFLERCAPGYPTLRTVTVKVPRLVPARNTGLDAARRDIVAMVDDDTAPHPIGWHASRHTSKPTRGWGV